MVTQPPGRFRQFCMGFTVFVACLCTVLAATSYWVHQTLLDTGHYVAVVRPIGRDPAVTKALSAYLSEQLLEVVDAQKVIRDALPESGRILAGPLVSAVQTFVQGQIDKLLQTPAFQQAWTVANRTAHATAVAVLRDETGSKVVQTSNGKVALNLLPLVNEALRRLQDASPDILGHEVKLPEITSGDIPADARKKISDALGVTLPADFGQIVVFDSDELQTAQDVVKWFDGLVVVLVISAVVLLAFTVWVSHRRRRTLMQLGVGVAIGLVVARSLAVLGRDDVVDAVKDPVNRAGVGAALDHILGSYFGFTAWLIFLSLLVATIAFVSAPTPRAVQLRTGTRRLLREAAEGLARTGREHADEPVLHWVRANHVTLQVAGAAVVVLLVLVSSPSLLALLLLVLLLGAYEFVVHFLSAARVVPAPAAVPGGPVPAANLARAAPPELRPGRPAEVDDGDSGDSGGSAMPAPGGGAGSGGALG